jgi:hypothetical protein
MLSRAVSAGPLTELLGGIDLAAGTPDGSAGDRVGAVAAILATPPISTPLRHVISHIAPPPSRRSATFTTPCANLSAGRLLQQRLSRSLSVNAFQLIGSPQPSLASPAGLAPATLRPPAAEPRPRSVWRISLGTVDEAVAGNSTSACPTPAEFEPPAAAQPAETQAHLAPFLAARSPQSYALRAAGAGRGSPSPSLTTSSLTLSPSPQLGGLPWSFQLPATAKMSALQHAAGAAAAAAAAAVVTVERSDESGSPSDEDLQLRATDSTPGDSGSGSSDRPASSDRAGAIGSRCESPSPRAAAHPRPTSLPPPSGDAARRPKPSLGPPRSPLRAAWPHAANEQLTAAGAGAAGRAGAAPEPVHATVNAAVNGEPATWPPSPAFQLFVVANRLPLTCVRDATAAEGWRLEVGGVAIARR